MPVNDILAALLAAVNEILAAAIVVIAVSLLLYNLTRNRSNRVARSSAAVLASVTFAYICDVYLSLGPDPATAQAALRLQWIGIAIIPAALFHLSDALLATTGLPSRGRRRRVVRALYLLSSLFLLLVGFTNSVVDTVVLNSGTVVIQARPIFWIYAAYFIVAAIVTFINVQRARKRGLTPASRRRMAYLQATILMPVIGIFPFSALLPPNDDVTLIVQILVNIGNIVVILMLLFLSYPLSFFGSNIPDRVVKVELLRFLLRGPGTALLVLALIVLTRRSIDILGLPGEDFMPFAAVAGVLVWQWGIALVLPWLEARLIYSEGDDEQLARLQDLSERLLTHDDLTQLLAATLEALSEYLRTNIAFVAQKSDNEALDLIETAGDFDTTLNPEQASQLLALASNADRVTGRSAFQRWGAFQVVPLYSRRLLNGDEEPVLIGVMGIKAEQNPVTQVDHEDAELVYTYVQRAENTLDDLILQDEIFAALEGLLPQIIFTRQRADEVAYRPGRTKPKKYVPTRDETYEQVRAALRHYWGGPGISRSRLIELEIVQDQLAEADTPIQALRAVLKDAIELQRPEGERSMTAPEWTLFNILDLRFLERKKVKDVARRMSVSEADLYRKQRLAIQAVSDSILQMEREHDHSTGA